MSSSFIKTSLKFPENLRTKKVLTIGNIGFFMAIKKDLLESWENSCLITDERLLEAFKKVRREDFVLKEYRNQAYEDIPLPILKNQTISQPTTVMLMLQALELKETDNVLEIGSGSGYNAALISEMVKRGKVCTIEIIPELHEFAKLNLKYFKNVNVILSDGSIGLKDFAPYDKIIVTASSPKIPERLLEQLKINGLLIVPVGSQSHQEMLIIRKFEDKLEIKNLGNFVFVPLTGEEGH